MLWFYFLLIFTFFGSINSQRTFTIDYENHQFLKDGKPFRYIAGQIEYFRIPRELWDDRLMRVQHAGLNAIYIYVPWNFHETFEGDFKFSNEANITEFIELAQSKGLYVIVRPGPYICGEWENGGLPYWLLKKKDIKLRVYNQPWNDAVKNYYNHLLPILKPYLYKNGGPILMLQIENEYGSYNCDKKYLEFLRDTVWDNLGNDTLLFSTDPPIALLCGHVDGVFTTVDFGPNGDVKGFLALQQDVSKGGPLVNSEFYPGWYTIWNYGNATYPTTEKVIEAMSEMWNLNASFSFYMIHGGTNFGFWNGAETYGAVITSYDYGAPIAENGDITDQYLAVSTWIDSLPNWDNPPLEIPSNNPVKAYGEVTLKMTDTLLKAFSNYNSSCQQSDSPLSFETLDHPYGFVLYQKKLDFVGVTLRADNIKDYGYVYINDAAQGVLVGNLDKLTKTTLSFRNVKKGDTLSIIVENRGRQTFESILDYKGLLPDVTLGNSILTNWKSCPVDIDAIVTATTAKNIFPSNIETNKIISSKTMTPNNPFDQSSDTAGIYVGTFDIPEGSIADTWLNPGSFRKGQLFINGFNLGRYWPIGGPQVTLYVPATILKSKNTIIMVELLGRGTVPTISFVDKPIYN